MPYVLSVDGIHQLDFPDDILSLEMAWAPQRDVLAVSMHPSSGKSASPGQALISSAQPSNTDATKP